MKRTCCIALVLTVCLAAAAAADIPLLLSYQGVLTDGGGVAVPDNTYSIAFAIYNVPDGGSALWTETDNVIVSKGTFSATLGTISGLSSLSFNETYYIGMSIDGGPELPRQILTTSPYSFTAKSVLGTENAFPSSGNVGIGTLSPTHPLTVSTSSQIGIQLNGSEANYANLYVNAVNPIASPGFGLQRQGTLRSFQYVDSADRWHHKTASTVDAIIVPTTGEVGVGVVPAEKLHINGGIMLGNTAGTGAGTMRWTGSDFEGYDGATWKSFTATGGGTLPSGSLNNTLRHNGVDWVATSNLTNDGTMIGIGTTAPTRDLDIYRDANATVGITIENPNTGASSTHRIDFADENGTIAGLTMHDDDNPSYASQMRLFNNRPGASLVLLAGSGSVHINDDGKVGIDVTNPAATMHVKGGNWDLAATEGDLMIGDATYRLKFGVATGGGGAGTAGIRVAGGLGRLILGSGTAEVLGLDATGAVDIGSSSANGELKLYRSGMANRVLHAYTNAQGGNLDFFDESNNAIGAWEADYDGSGGYFSVYRTVGSAGFVVDGNAAGVQEPWVGIMGSSQSVTFDMDQSGTNTVVLPPSAIHSTEIADEPGAASYVEGGVTGIALTNSNYNILGSRTIVTPAAGHVLVMATCQARETHAGGTEGRADFGVSATSASLPANQEVNWDLPGALPAGTYQVPLTVHGLFTVGSGGSYTYYFLGYPTSGSFYCYDFQLTLIYIPTSYGTIDPTVAGAAVGEAESGGGRALSEDQVASARTDSEAVNAARMQRELDAMRAELEEVKARLENK